MRQDRSSGIPKEPRWNLSTSILVGLLLLACVSACQRAETKLSLAERVAKYWELKQSKGWEEVYDGFLDPKTKGTLSREGFLKTRRLAYDILSFQLGPIADAGDTADVTVENEVNFPLREPTGQMRLIKKRVTTNERWVRRDGTWYIELEK